MKQKKKQSKMSDKKTPKIFNPTNSQYYFFLNSGNGRQPVLRKVNLLLRMHFFASSPPKSVKFSWVARMGGTFDGHPGFQPKATTA